ncbi:MAG: Asp-tRNA(Asn)/Glu-tRNA(Gln) amidotransferase subunit GatA [candidate division Zixibacteria bacterium]|jgi:aspartyl-tRNA(Asn)/glutamyl-tRNA(Gln) amidotransferase subunit A|nr:Asp-tRNA(Asn)/Glu-tRNA(Gln) amidotransferase subunit GatA [candidate division Zixibacteria bacterium]
MIDYTAMSANEIAESVRTDALSAVGVTTEALRRANTIGKDLNAFITLCEEKALAQAGAVDRMKADRKSRLPLAGVPVAIKDNISYTGYPMTCGSRILQGYVPPYDATVVSRLIDAGAVIIGKTNLDEFAMGSSNENSYYGPVKNPVDHTRAPGGSSGGSAAAVASGIVPLAFGSETGGSVRQPASFCGLLGLKPTYGAISRYGLTAFASSTDQISPFARTVEDLALIFSIVAGRDENDSTSVAFRHPDYRSRLALDRSLVIGLPKEYMGQGLDPDVERAIGNARDTLEKLGHRCVDISLPMTDKAIPTYYVIASAEASANLARFDGVRYGLRESGDRALEQMYSDTRAKGFGAEVKRRIMLGTYALSAGYYDAYYTKAAQVRELMRREFDESFKSVNLILSPTAPTPAFRLGEKITDPLAMYLSDVYTAPASLTGNPALSVPFAKSRDGLPIGIQFIAPHFDEQTLFQVAGTILRAQ